MPMFPYPSGDSMHVGHASNYIINDFVARYKKMQWFDVIHPMGFDSFGLPTENYAIKTGKSARQATKENIINFKEQIKAINLQFDPDREFATSDPEYYKRTQWIFARLFEHGLAYKKDGLVNRCNGCQTVLANDQVVDGKCERCETIIIQKKHPQRYIKTTALADELIDDLDLIDRPEETKTIQKNWIGRSFGAEIDFMLKDNWGKLWKVEENNLTITVFTTRPDTLYGVTALVLAPENQIIDHLLSSEKVSELTNFRAEVAKLTAIDRQSTEREKKGMNTGLSVIHPLTGELVPLRFADYVLMDYATGAVMMVPAHDERDREFAKKYGIAVKWVIDGWNMEAAYTETWILINSWQFNGTDNITAKTAITEHLETLWLWRKKKTFRLRDRSVSRQRYRWSPIPVYYTFEDNQKVPFWPAKEWLEIHHWKPIITRNVVKVAIKHRSENKYLLIKNEKLGQHLVAGWVEHGETREEAAIREAKEETIYTNFQVIKHIPSQVQSCFYNPNKGENRYLVEEMVVLQLINEEKSPSELAWYEFLRIDEKELGEKLPYLNEQYNWYEYFDPSKKPTPPAYIDRYNTYNPHPDKSKWISHIIPDEDLPVVLPLDLPNYKPAGKSPLEDHPTFKYYKPSNNKVPFFQYTNWEWKFREWENTIVRKTIIAIVKNKSSDEFLMIKWKWLPTISCVLWWVEEWENWLQACIREIKEEGWFEDAEFIKKIWGEFHSKFRHPNKKRNQYNIAECYYFEVDKKNQLELSSEEQNKHEVIRVDKNQVRELWNDPINSYYFDILFWNSVNAPDYIDQYNEYNPRPIYLRECDTLDTFMCSSFYFLRYLDPANTDQLISDTAAANMPVDLYIGGKEHAVWHLIYSRFIYKFLQKYGYIHTEAKEPFVKLIHQGMVHAADGRKFSKRRGNGINPLDVVREHNTDTLRTYLAFMGPIELPKNRNPDGVAGVGRFLKRFEKLVEFRRDDLSGRPQSDNALVSIIHQTIKTVWEDMDNLKFNTAISKLMIATNAIYESGAIDTTSLQSLILLLAPFAPETAQRMWIAIGQNEDVTKQSRPTYDSQLIHNSTIELPIQINGKTKWSLSVPKDITQDEVVVLVRQDEKMSKYLEWWIKKIIRVPGRICNIIV